MTEGLAPAIQARFRVLQQAFVAGLAARQGELEAAATPQERQAVLHRLCGAAGSFGLERLSACARAAEALALSGSPEELAQALALLKAQIELAQSAERADPVPPLP
jgi:HPt (histidine-containing phosphotransfer) domain-containing protein